MNRTRPSSWEGLKLLASGDEKTIVGMVERKMDDRAYYYDQFYRHDIFISGSSCLRFTPDYGHFRRHADILKRLPCLQLKFQRSPAAGTMMGFEAYHACGWQMPQFPKLCIASFLQNWAILEFSIAGFSLNEASWETTLPASALFFAEWAESENLHYKPTMPIFWNQHFCVKFTGFHVGKDRRKQC